MTVLKMYINRHIKLFKIMFNIFTLILFAFVVLKQTSRKPKVYKIIRFVSDIKHILIWTNIYQLNKEGQNYFIEQKCDYSNCYLSKNRSLFGDMRYFDMILFNLQDVSGDNTILPHVRGQNQKYVFVANDSAHKYPICDSIYEGFFNWTWTYKYDSTLSYRFISIYNIQFEELGSHFLWTTSMKPIDAKIKSQFATKSKAAAIFLDNCHSISKRELIVYDLQRELAKYNLTVDIFGDCSDKKCKRRSMNSCYWRLKKIYYFYLAFEESLAKDYITDIVLYGYNNNAVPVVYGGANYDRFLPPESYVNVSNKTTRQLASTMNEIISNRDLYHSYFRWKNHYIISKGRGINGCDLCKLLNNPELLTQQYSHEDFRMWWYPKYEERCEVYNRFL